MQTANAAFRVMDLASGPVKKITENGQKMIGTMTKAGDALDDIDSPKVTSSLKNTTQNVDKLQKSTTEMAGAAKRNTEVVGKSFEKMRNKGAKSIEELTALIRRFEHERATAQLDVDIAGAEAKIRILKHELRTLTTAQARSELADLGVGVEELTTGLVGGGGGGGPPGVRGGLAGGFFAAGGRAAFMGAAFLAALPAIVVLTGAISALIGSLGAAVGGAGAVGIGVFGMAAVGLAAIASVAIPAAKAIGNAKKAQDAYNKAVQQYGKDSSQAISAHKKMQQEFKRNQGVGDILQNAKVLGKRFRQQTGPGRQAVFGIVNDALETANDLLPTFSRTVNRVMASSRRAVRDFFAVFRTNEMKGIISTLGDTFSASIGPGMRALGQFALWLGRISRAASPLVIRFFQWMERGFEGLADRASNVNSVQKTIERLVDHTKEWWRFTKAVVHLFGAFFGSGAEQGKNMLEGITDQLDKWASWIDTHPAEMQAFFDRTIDGATKLVSALAEIAKALAQIGDALIPVLNLFTQLTSLAGGGGALGPLALLGAVRFGLGKGALGKLGGKVLGRGGAAAGAEAAAGGVAAGSGIRGGLQAARGMSAGGIAKSVGKAALRKAGPLALAFGAWDFATAGGGIGNRLGAAANGALFGIPGALGLWGGDGGAGARASGTERAQAFAMAHPQGLTRQIGHLQRRLGERQELPGQYEYKGGVQVQRLGGHVLSGDARRRAQQELDTLKPILRAQLKIEGKEKATKSFDDIIRAFDIRWKGKGSVRAGKGLVEDIRTEMRGLPAAGRSEMRAMTAQMTAQLETGTKAQRRVAHRLKKWLKDEYADIGKNIQIVNGRILQGTRSEWSAISKAMSSRAEKAAQEVSKSFTALQREAVGSLVAMGFTRGQANKLIRGLESGSVGASTVETATSLQQGTPGEQQAASNIADQTYDKSKKARGGRIGGVGRSDYVHMGNSITAPGELVVPDSAEWRADQRLGYPGALEDIINRNRQPHNMRVARATGGRVEPLNARRGGTQGTPGVAGVTPAISRLISRLDSMGFHHGSTTGGGHAKNGFHPRGMAVDYGDASNDMKRLWATLYPERSQFAEMFGPVGLKAPTLMHYGQGFQDAALQAGHNDHIHLALAQAMGARGLEGLGSVGAVASQAIKLRRRRSRLGGVPGALSTRGQDVVRKAMETQINSAVGAQGGTGDLGAGVNGSNASMARQMMLRMWPAAQWSPLKSLWTQESGFSETATNPSSGAYGIPQALPPGKMGADAQGSGPAAAKAQIAWGLRYIKGRYGSPGAAWGFHQKHNWYGMGGRMPEWGGWHGKGADFTARSPTLIGVGDGGRKERVRVEPDNGLPSGGGAASYTFHIGTIVNREPGDIKKILKREIDALEKELVHGENGTEMDD